MKFDLNLPCTITLTDAMPLLKRVFLPAYDNLDANVTATANSGWYPSNCKLIGHHSLQKDGCLTVASSLYYSAAHNLNLEDGMAATVFDWSISKKCIQIEQRMQQEREKKVEKACKQ